MKLKNSSFNVLLLSKQSPFTTVNKNDEAIATADKIRNIFLEEEDNEEGNNIMSYSIYSALDPEDVVRTSTRRETNEAADEERERERVKILFCVEKYVLLPCLSSQDPTRKFG